MTLKHLEIKEVLKALRCCWNCRFYTRGEDLQIDGSIGSVCSIDRERSDRYLLSDEIHPGDKHMPPQGLCERFRQCGNTFGLPDGPKVPGLKLNYRYLHSGAGGHHPLMEIATLIIEKTKDPEFGRVLIAFALIAQTHHRLKDSENQLWRWLNYWHLRWDAQGEQYAGDHAIDFIRMMLDSYEAGMRLENGWWPRVSESYSERAVAVLKECDRLDAISRLVGNEVRPCRRNERHEKGSIYLEGWYDQPIHCPFCGAAYVPDSEGCKHLLYVIFQSEFQWLSTWFLSEMGLPLSLTDEWPVSKISEVEGVFDVADRARRVIQNLVEFEIDCISDAIRIAYASLPSEYVGWGLDHQSPYEGQ